MKARPHFFKALNYFHNSLVLISRYLIKLDSYTTHYCVMLWLHYSWLYALHYFAIFYEKKFSISSYILLNMVDHK